MEYLELQSVIKEGSTITDVKYEDNRLLFKVDGHLFSTYDYHVHHKNHPLFNHPVTSFFARRHNTPEGIAEEEESQKKLDKEIDLFYKHKTSLYKIVFLRAFEILKETNDDSKFVKFIEHHFDVLENDDNCQKLIKELEKT